MSALVIFDSKHGSTADIAARIAEKLGEGVRLAYLRDKGAQRIGLDDCDLVVLGAPIYAGSWSKRAALFARTREADLAGKAFAYFSTGAMKAGGTEIAKAALPASLAEKAVASAALGGEFRWNKLNMFERFILKLVSGKKGDLPSIDEKALAGFTDKLAVHAKSAV